MRFRLGRLLSLLMFSGSFFILDVQSVSAAGIVPCTEGRDCGTCELIMLLESVVQFIINIMLSVAVILFMYAGFLIATAAGKMPQVERGKSIFLNVLVGLIIMLCAWLIVDTVLKTLLPNGETSFGPWNQLSDSVCTAQDAVADGALTEFDNGWKNISVNYNPTTQFVVVTDSRTGQELYTGTVPRGKPGIVAFAEEMQQKGCIYNQSRRNGCIGNPGYTDCSDLVHTAYTIAGCQSPGTYTGNQISYAQPIVNTSTLQPGDALIHRTNGAGHVVICRNVGCTSVIHAAGTGKNIVVGNGASYYNDPRYKVIRAALFCN